MKAFVKTKVKKETCVQTSVQTSVHVHDGFAHEHEKIKEIALASALRSVHLDSHPCHCGHSNFDMPPDMPYQSDGSAMGTDFTTAPFAFLESRENSEKINAILRFSLRQQKEDEISNNSTLVTHTVSRCLTAAGIANRVAYGYRRTTSDDSDDFAKTPHIWLVIDGCVVDNTYIKYLTVKCCKYLAKHTPSCYKEKGFESSSFTGSEKAKQTTDEQLVNLVKSVMEKRIEFSMKHPDKALAMGHNREQFYNYFFAMLRYMYEVYDLTVPGIDPNVRLVCWHCDLYPDGKDLYSDTLTLRESRQLAEIPSHRRPEKMTTLTFKSPSWHSWRFPQCDRCMVANYCSVACQSQDWEDFHSETCLARGSSYLPPISNVLYREGC